LDHSVVNCSNEIWSEVSRTFESGFRFRVWVLGFRF
jgi:hypothetical protein